MNDSSSGDQFRDVAPSGASRTDDVATKNAEEAARARRHADAVLESERSAPNPPRTTTGRMTSPKFGNAGSGGAELEPGPERY